MLTLLCRPPAEMDAWLDAMGLPPLLSDVEMALFM